MSLSTKRVYPLRKRKDCPASKKPTPFPFSCSWCTFRCQVQHVLTAHLKVHNLYTKCSVDGCTFSTKETHDKHIQMKDQDSLNDNSPLPLKNSVELNTNNIVPTTPNTSKRSDNSKRFVCEKNCGYSTDRNSNLQVHIRRHTGEKPYACGFEGCSYRSVGKTGLVNHKYVHAPGTKPFACDVEECLFRCVSKANLKRHKKMHAPLEKKSLAAVCQDCGYVAVNNYHLQDHIRRHTGDKPYVCDFEGCSYRSVNKGDLKKHKYRHAPETKPYVCEYCGLYATANASSLRSHMRRHTCEKPYACDFMDCQYRCSIKSELKIHKYVHYPETKPIKCDLCSYRTTAKLKLRQHHNSHHQIKVKDSSGLVWRKF